MDSFLRTRREGETGDEYFAALQELVKQRFLNEFPELPFPLESAAKPSPNGPASTSRPEPAARSSPIGPASTSRLKLKWYKKTVGAANDMGVSFEWKMLTLVFLRLLAACYEFTLASNMEDAGLFDDIVVRYRKPSSETWISAYVQLKHKDSKNKKIQKKELLGLTGDFSLVRYCASYESVVSRASGRHPSFFIFTNATINEFLVNELESDPLLTTGGKAVSFKAGGEVYQELCEWVDFKETLTELHGQVKCLSDEDVGIRVKDAFESLVYKSMFVTSCKEDLLKSPTLLKLSDLLEKLKLVSDKETYSLFLAELKVYTNQSHESELDAKIKEEVDKIWVCSDDSEAKIMLHNLKDKVKTWWQKEHFYLTQDSRLWLEAITSQTEALSKSTIEGLTKTGANFEENCLKILYDAFSCCGITNVIVNSRTAASSLKVHQALAKFGEQDSNILQVNMKALLTREDDVLSAWATRWCQVLVVDCDEELDRKDAVRISARMLQEVGRENEKKQLVLIASKKHELNVQLYHAESYKRFNDNFAWSDLTEKTKARFLLSQVVINGIQSPQDLSKLLVDDKRFVNKADFEVISQLLQGDLALGKELDIESKHFVTRRLQESSGGVPFVVNSVRDVPGKVVLVVAEPGMGKSTLITHLSKSSKAKDKTMWIMHIKLNDCTQYLQEIEVENFNEAAAKKFLEKALLSPENYLEKLLIGSLGKRLAIFVDGVDEVCPHYEEEVFALLKILKEMQICHLWVTSRPVFRTKLEKYLGVQTFDIVPFSERDRIEFFKKIFGELKPTATPEECSKKSENLLTRLTDSLGKDNTILGVPLMNAMIAETFADSKFEENQLQNMNLYKSFVQKKFHVYCEEKKMTVNRELAANIHDEDNLRKQMHRNHRLAALRALFSPEEISSFQFEGKERFAEDLAKYLKEISDGREKIGIIDNVIDGIPHFVHRSIAEYFAATWLEKNFKANQELVERIIFEPVFKLVSEMFQRSLAENHHLHVAVLNRDIEALKSTPTTSPENRNVKVLDAGGRTALHLAVLLSGTDRHHDYTDIVIFLLQENKALDVADEVLGWVPLRYAERSGAWRALHVILENVQNERNGKGSLPRMIEGWPKPDPSSMLDAARDASVLVVRYLVKERGGKLNCRGPEGDTMYHKAAEGGNIEMMKYLHENEFSMRNIFSSVLSVNTVNNQGLTPLQVAAQNGMYDAMDFFLSKKASLDVSTGAKASEVQLNASLLCAAYAGKIKFVKTLVEKGSSFDHQDRNGHTAVWFAKKQGHVEVMNWLLLRESPMAAAASEGNLDMVTLLLEKGASVECRDKAGWTPLHRASDKGYDQFVALLLSHGADVTAEDNEGRTPLYHAALSNKLAVVTLLLEKGASVECRDKAGKTPLHRASFEGHDQVVALLLRHGADVTAEDIWGQTPLHVATLSNKLAVVTLLLEKGASVECRDKAGWTPLHRASLEGHDQVVALLLRHGADVTAEDSEGRTPLYHAALYNELAVVTLLLEKGASVECRDKAGKTPLHRASLEGHDQVVALLLRHGADVTAEDSEGRTPLYHAALYNELAVVTLLLEKGASVECRDKAGWTPLHRASYEGHDQVVALLLRHGADVTAEDSWGRTPLYHAALYNKLAVVTLLLEKGASVECRDKAGKTPLHRASDKGHDQVVALLLRHGADVTAEDIWGQTPLHVATLSNKLAVVTLLLEKGASVECRDKAGWTPLHRASLEGHDQVVALLLRHGADVTAEDSEGRTPLYVAAWNNKLAVVKLLKEAGARMT